MFIKKIWAKLRRKPYVEAPSLNLDNFYTPPRASPAIRSEPSFPNTPRWPDEDWEARERRRREEEQNAFIAMSVIPAVVDYTPTTYVAPDSSSSWSDGGFSGGGGGDSGGGGASASWSDSGSSSSDGGSSSSDSGSSSSSSD